MKTKAQQLGITKFPYVDYDDKGNVIYREDSNGSWWKSEFNKHNNLTYREYDDGEWYKWKHNDKGDDTYTENNHGYKVYFII